MEIQTVVPGQNIFTEGCVWWIGSFAGGVAGGIMSFQCIEINFNCFARESSRSARQHGSSYACPPISVRRARCKQ